MFYAGTLVAPYSFCGGTDRITWDQCLIHAQPIMFLWQESVYYEQLVLLQGPVESAYNQRFYLNAVRARAPMAANRDGSRIAALEPESFHFFLAFPWELMSFSWILWKSLVCG